MKPRVNCLINGEWQTECDSLCGLSEDRIRPIEGEYFKNWYIKYDLACMKPEDYTWIGSAYFIGFVLGSMFFKVPDQLGRKTAMSIFLPAYAFANVIVIVAEDLSLKATGFFLCGLFHIKQTIAYQHAYELMPPGAKPLAATVINVFDCATLTITSLCLIYLANDIDTVFIAYMIINLICMPLYFCIIPESPIWLFLEAKEAHYRSEKGVNVLNYMAEYNGSTFRAE